MDASSTLKRGLKTDTSVTDHSHESTLISNLRGPGPVTHLAVKLGSSDHFLFGCWQAPEPS